jgi:PAS domain S-box-containing protein
MAPRRKDKIANFDVDRQRLAAIVDSSNDAIISTDLNGIVTSWNRAAERIFGYTAEEIIGKPVSILAPTQHGEEMPRAIERIQRGARLEHYYTIRQRKNGERIHVSVTISPICDPAGRIIGASKIARDITERIQAEAERALLLEREREAREAVENALEQHRDLEKKLSVLVEASGALLASLRSEDVLTHILVLAQRFVAADAYAVWRADEDGRMWRMARSSGFRNAGGDSYSFSRSDSISGDLLVVPDVMASPLLQQRRRFYEIEGIRSLLMAPLFIRQAFSGAITLYFRTTHDFAENEVRVITALANLASSAMTNAELYEEQARLREQAELNAQRSSLLARASVALGSSLDFHTTLRDVARLAVPAFADWCSVDILSPDGGIERLAVEHVDPAKIAAATQLRNRYPVDLSRPHGLGRVLQSGRAELYPEITGEMLAAAAQDDQHLQLLREVGLCSAIIAPLRARSRVLGAMTFASAESGRRFGDADLATAMHLAERAALAIDNSRLLAEAERERAEAQQSAAALRRSNEELEQFAYVSSHDLQEPLRNVASYAQLLASRYRGRLDADADEFIGYIVDGARRMSGLIQDLLMYSRLIRTGPAPRERVPADSALDSALLNLQKSIRESHAVITRDPLPVVLGHFVQISQVFQNLIGNAIKYRSEEEPKIHVSAEIQSGECVFSVSDNGIGIDPAYHTRIFGLFKRLHGRNIPGTGIGLATCKKIVEQHGGRIWLESQPGKGSIFRFSLPLHSESDTVEPVTKRLTAG